MTSQSNLASNMGLLINVSSRGISQIGVLFFQRALATEEGVACLQWKASVLVGKHRDHA